MSKRWTYKDDDFLVRYHEIGADYIADHDLGFKAKGAGTRRLSQLRETGLFDLIKAAQDAVSRATASHTLAFSRSEEAKEIAEFALADLDASEADKAYSHPTPGDRGGCRSENNEGDTLEGVVVRDDDTRMGAASA